MEMSKDRHKNMQFSKADSVIVEPFSLSTNLRKNILPDSKER